MTDYTFYSETYRGDSIEKDDFPRLALRAEAVLERYRRIYTVTAPKPDSESMALCALADALYAVECAQSGGDLHAASVGSVSESYGGAQSADLSAGGQARELYRSASLYLDIYRGCGPC